MEKYPGSESRSWDSISPRIDALLLLVEAEVGHGLGNFTSPLICRMY